MAVTARPADIMRVPASHTGRALAEGESPLPFGSVNAVRDAGAAQAGAVQAGAVQAGSAAYGVPSLPTSIEIHGAREHNLKNVDVSLGLNKFTVITGVSGSGKSTLAFDILFAEGQRRYLESLNAYARQFVQPASRPDVDAIFGIPPTVAIEQRTSRGGHKSTVATLTEIYHFLRLLYVKLGVQYCPACEVRIEPQSAECAIAARLLKDYRGRRSSPCWRPASWRARACIPRLRNGRSRARVSPTCRSMAYWCRLQSGRVSTASSNTISNCPWRR